MTQPLSTHLGPVCPHLYLGGHTQAASAPQTRGYLVAGGSVPPQHPCPLPVLDSLSPSFTEQTILGNARPAPMLGNFRFGKLCGKETCFVIANVAPHQMSGLPGRRPPIVAAGDAQRRQESSVKLFCFSPSCHHLPKAGMDGFQVGWV